MVELDAIFMEHAQTKDDAKVGHAIKITVGIRGNEKKFTRLFIGNSINDSLYHVSRGLTDLLRGELSTAPDATEQQPQLKVLENDEGKEG